MMQVEERSRRNRLKKTEAKAKVKRGKTDRPLLNLSLLYLFPVFPSTSTLTCLIFFLSFSIL